MRLMRWAGRRWGMMSICELIEDLVGFVSFAFRWISSARRGWLIWVGFGFWFLFDCTIPLVARRFFGRYERTFLTHLTLGMLHMLHQRVVIMAR